MKVLKLLVPMIFGLCFFCRSAMVCSVPVAADGAFIQLTAEQTLALYGRQLEGYFYNKNTERTYNITFNYQMTMDRWRPNDYRATPTYIHSWAGSVNNDDVNIKTGLESSQFLIYCAAADANTYPFPTYGGGDGTHSNVYLECPFSVEFSDLMVWDQYVMWSNWWNYNRYPAERSFVTNRLDTNMNVNRIPQYGYYAANMYHRMSLAQFPIYPAVSVEAVPNDESKIMYGSVIHNRIIGGDSYFDLTSQSFTLNWCDKYDVDNMGTGLPIETNYPGGSLNGHKYLLFVFISCPYVSSLNPLPDFTSPATTATGIGTTATYQTFPTVDLSALESGVGTMVQMQDEGNYYSRIQIDQLNMIIQQLDSIYAKMVQNGEVPVSLNPADAARRFDTSILDQVNSAATSYTIAQLPQDYAGNGATGIGAFIAQVVGVDPIFMTIGLFSIGFAIFCWFVFRGRGGV